MSPRARRALLRALSAPAPTVIMVLLAADVTLKLVILGLVLRLLWVLP